MDLHVRLLWILSPFQKYKVALCFLCLFICATIFVYNNRDSEFVNPHRVKMGINRRWSWLGECSIVPENWILDKIVACENNFIQYGKQFAVLRNITMKPGINKFFIACANLDKIKASYRFEISGWNNYLNKWLSLLESYPESMANKIVSTNSSKPTNGLVPATNESRVTIALLRIDLHNIYHTFTELYNVFFVCKLLNISTDNVHVLFNENHQTAGPYIGLWTTLYGRPSSIRNMTNVMLYNQLIWTVSAPSSPIDFHCIKQPPFIHSFREYILDKFAVQTSKSLDCKNVSIFFIKRRDYSKEIHGRYRITARKILNEEELVKIIKTRYKNAHVTNFPLDGMEFRDQLKVVTNTDILMGMHGAGMAQVLFLPQHAGVVEFFPAYYPKYPGRTYFEVWSKWLGLKYVSWQNSNPNNEYPNMYTNIPHTVVEADRKSVV